MARAHYKMSVDSDNRGVAIRPSSTRFVMCRSGHAVTSSRPSRTREWPRSTYVDEKHQGGPWRGRSHDRRSRDVLAWLPRRTDHNNQANPCACADFRAAVIEHPPGVAGEVQAAGCAARMGVAVGRGDAVARAGLED